jgi:hypothetical protein
MEATPAQEQKQDDGEQKNLSPTETHCMFVVNGSTVRVRSAALGKSKPLLGFSDPTTWPWN